MGRIGDGDVHAAYVEFRAKESDKVRFLLSFVLSFVSLHRHLFRSVPFHSIQFHVTINKTKQNTPSINTYTSYTTDDDDDDE